MKKDSQTNSFVYLRELLSVIKFDYEISNKHFVSNDIIITAPNIRLIDEDKAYLGGYSSYIFTLTDDVAQRIINRLDTFWKDSFLADLEEKLGLCDFSDCSTYAEYLSKINRIDENKYDDYRIMDYIEFYKDVLSMLSNPTNIIIDDLPIKPISISDIVK